MLDDIKKDAITRMTKCVQTFAADAKKLRTGRAHPSLVEHLKVDYYGSDTPLNQVANIAVEDGRTLVISPWEKTMVQPIEKAISVMLCPAWLANPRSRSARNSRAAQTYCIGVMPSASKVRNI